VELSALALPLLLAAAVGAAARRFKELGAAVGAAVEPLEILNKAARELTMAEGEE
jgi:hypothetical protein